MQTDLEPADLERFAAAATRFLDEHATPLAGADRPWGEGSDSVALMESPDAETEALDLANAKAWAATRFDAGFGWIDGPPELGGAGLSAAHRRTYRLLERGYDVPNQAWFLVGMALVGPTLLEFGSAAAKAALLPPLFRGDLLACQLFSEPGAGSDLASLSTRAEADGNVWRITGQKVWTSNAHVADVGLILCRTDPTTSRHRGITAFIVDMRAPGIDVRPLRQMTGGAGFNEVFLDGVEVDDRWRVGAVGEGWRVAMATLSFERASLGEWSGLGPGFGPFARLRQLVQHTGRDTDPVVREILGRIYSEGRVLDWTSTRILEDVLAGNRSDTWLSVLRLMKSKNLATVADLVGRVLGPRMLADTGEWGTYAWAEFVCGVPGMRLGGGSDEVVRNVLGERLLALPKEPPA